MKFAFKAHQCAHLARLALNLIAPMKKATYVVTGLLLIGYAVFTTVRISRLQAHVNQLETSRHVLAAALVQDLYQPADELPKRMSPAQWEAIRVQFGLPAAPEQVQILSSGIGVNGTPGAVSSK